MVFTRHEKECHMRKWTLACAVLTVAAVVAADAPAQERLTVQPTPVIRSSERSVRTGPVRRILGRREVTRVESTAPQTVTTVKGEQLGSPSKIEQAKGTEANVARSKVEQAQGISPMSQPQVVESDRIESRRTGLLSRLRSRFGRS
jgi:hypothetical protein